ncbi:hypothetical protein [uncultured Ruminococcus sp.]|uniref:hypothetical protein n=1 Tax=uncultured Ruminococcus sp. TaxID=165186 RepID=UPI0025D90FF9|nr:hypothetical protein [uncultured Ruminococcus sp.]
MKKLVLITGIILMVCLFTSVYATPAATVGTQVSVIDENKGNENEVFVLKSENNYIVVYKFGENTPYMTTDTLVSTLPKGDIMLLEKGIEVKGEENLKKSLEDFCS